MHAKRRRPRIPLPKSWPRHVKSAVLHVISLAHYAIVRARGRAESRAGSHERFLAENERLSEECALLREEIRIKDLRMAQIPPQKRPRYRPGERMAILELRAARGWCTGPANFVVVLPGRYPFNYKRLLYPPEPDTRKSFGGPNAC